MKTEVLFSAQCDNPDAGWSLKVGLDGQRVMFGMYWADKATPTHTFSLTKRAFRKMADELAPRKEKK